MGVYILNDDFNGGTWTDSNGVVHQGSSGVANTLPSTSIWNIATGVAGNTFNGSGELVYYPGTTTYLFQDGASHLCFTTGKVGTGGAPGTLYPSGYVDTSKSGLQSTGTPKYSVQLNQTCEIKVKVNPLNGLWTACWFIGANSQYDSTWSEIDMEEAGDSGTSTPLPARSNVTVWGGGVTNGNNPPLSGNVPTPNVNVGDGNYHVFRLQYGENLIQVFVDGVLNTSLSSSQIAPNSGPWNFNTNGGMYVVLQVHMSAANSGTPVASSLPFEGMLVDYVRIWNGLGPDPNGTGAAVSSTGALTLAPLTISAQASSAASGTVNATGALTLGPLVMSATANGGTGGGGAGSTASFTEAFGSDDTATNWSNSSGTTSVGNGWCGVQCDNTYSSSLQTTSTYNLTGSYVYGQFAPYQASQVETGLQLLLDANDNIVISYSNGTMFATLTQGGVQTTSSAPTYNALNHAWWRIREQTGTLFFDTAPNGQNWTNFWSTAYTMNVTSLFINVYAGIYGTTDPVAPTGTSYFTNLNLVPAAASTLIDGFDSNDLSTLWAWTFGTVSVAGSECSIAADPSYDSELISSVTYNLQGGSVGGAFLPFTSATAQTALQVFLGSGSENAAGPPANSTYAAEIGYLGGQMYATLYTNGTTTSSPTVTYSATNHAWWRIRESAGTLFFETSATSATWTTLWSTAYSFSVNGCTVAVFAGTGTGTGTSNVTNINVTGITSTGAMSLAPLVLNATGSSTTGSAVTSTGALTLGPLVLSATANNTPPLSLVGTPTLTRATSGSVTPVFGTGQTDTAGDLLIAVVTVAAATSATAPAAPAGWTLIQGIPSTVSTPKAYVAAYYLIAAGSDTLPAWTSTLAGTGAMTATIYEVTMYDSTGVTGWFDSYGMYASG